MIKLADFKITPLQFSPLYQTPSFPAASGPDYVNAVVLVMFAGESTDLLAHLHDIEISFGRTRTKRWGSRVLDIDLLFHGNQISPDTKTFMHWQKLPVKQQQIQAPNQLILPHPRIQDRAFVLVPLCDVAPNWVHPILSKSAIELLGAVPDAQKHDVRRLPD